MIECENGCDCDCENQCVNDISGSSELKSVCVSPAMFTLLPPTVAAFLLSHDGDGGSVGISPIYPSMCWKNTSNSQPYVIIDVYLAQVCVWGVGSGWGVGDTNFGRSDLGCIEVDLCTE